ncbi:hypothetical protein [Brevibacterium sp. ZH18]|uniref:hypothetical protein n=1 Tax=Brevibacterium sp. ZH18 TaxID=2927784 RepID=UPI001F61E398|nr:hypothetical protein [Brevibacterium sp. ZH18]MCI4010364.1 hypothetical protein [Brevibacterium sp. ZH18]
MRHDEERPQTTQLNVSAPVPGQWIQVLATMRANAFTRLSIEDIRAEAAHIIIASPSDEVTRASFAPLLEALSCDNFASDDFVEIMTPEAVVPADVPAGTWIFLPHRQDGWVELETTSARMRAALVKENTARAAEDKFSLMEFGVNLWLWAEPPYGGGDPVCHAGELISWESAWALGGASDTLSSASDTLSGASDSLSGTDVPRDSGSSAIRPPIYFGLPDVLRRRRMGE